MPDRPIDLPILYRDEFLVAVCKPSGLAVHRGWARDPTYALNEVRDRLGYRHRPAMGRGGAARPLRASRGDGSVASVKVPAKKNWPLAAERKPFLRLI